MSYQALAWARSVKTGSVATKAVLMAVANYADEEGTCFPSQAQLAEDTELSRRTIVRCLDVLEQAGLLSRSRRHRADGSRKSDLITLVLGDKEPRDTVAPRDASLSDTVSKPKCHGGTAEPITELPLTPSMPPKGACERDEVGEWFQKIRSVFPRRKGNNPVKPAEDRFRAKVKAGARPEDVFKAAQKFAKECATEGIAGTKYTPRLVSWLGQEAWEQLDDDAQVSPISSGRRLYAHRGTPQWDAWIEHYRRTGQPMKWLEGKSQMQVPSEWPPQERAA